MRTMILAALMFGLTALGVSKLQSNNSTYNAVHASTVTSPAHYLADGDPPPPPPPGWGWGAVIRIVLGA